MRASSRVSPGFSCACARFILFKSASPSVSLCFVMNFAESDGNRSLTGFGDDGWRIVPWCVTGRKPEPKLPLPLYGNPRESGRTTNVGRLSLRLPRPYEIHAPMQGKPGVRKPVVWRYTPGPCTFVRDVMAMRNARSSTQVAKCGKAVLTHRPDWPCCANSNGLRMMLPGCD